MPLQGDTPRQLVQSDTIMIDAPSIYDQQLAAMIRQVQGASAYLYKLSEDDRNNAKHQYNHLIEIVTDLQKGFTDESMKTANISAGIYEEFHRGSIDFARQIYEKLNEHETDLTVSKQNSDALCTAIQTALDGIHKINETNNQAQNEINKVKDAQVNDLNKRLINNSRSLKEAERALRRLQREKNQRTKETALSITPEEVQRLIQEGIERNKQIFPNQPRTPPNTGETSLRTAPEKQSQQQEWKQLTYCQHGKAGYCYTCDKYKPCPKCGTKNCKKGCKHRIHTPCQKCLDQGKAKKPPITD